MSIPFSGTPARFGGFIGAVAKQVRLVKLQPLKKITVQFDPFHQNVVETRNFLFYILSPKVKETNPSCFIKTDIVCDRSDPLITCNFERDEKLIFKSANLTALEILTYFNKHVSSRAPAEKKESEVTTKGIKKLIRRK